MRIFCLIFLGFISNAQAATHVLVSFSMPEQLLQETLKDSARFHLPVTLNGLYHNSMRETVQRIRQLSEKIPGGTFEIDPTLFERFSIAQVPALVVENGDCFDVIYGNLRLSEGFSRIEEKGSCGIKKPEIIR